VFGGDSRVALRDGHTPYYLGRNAVMGRNREGMETWVNYFILSSFQAGLSVKLEDGIYGYVSKKSPGWLRRNGSVVVGVGPTVMFGV
jgi:hypothetical protein